MRVSLISAMLMVSFVFSGIAQYKTDWEKLNLKGKVKNITTTEYAMDETEGENNTRIYQYSFNNKGYLTLESLREAMDTKYTNTYKYNAKNELTEETSQLQKSTSRRKYQYDTKNNTATINYYVANNNLITKTIQKYDGSGKMTERTVENLMGGNKKNKIVESYSFIYDNENRLKEEKRRIDTTNTTVSYKYDDNGRLIEKTEHDIGGITTYWSTYQYNEQGDVTEEVSAFRNYEKTVRKYTYVYGADGNWTERREQDESGNTITLSLRELSYYK